LNLYLSGKDLSDSLFYPVLLLIRLQMHLITDGIEHLAESVTLGVHLGPLRLDGDILFPEVALDIGHLLGMLSCQLLHKYYPLIQVLVKGGLLKQLVCQVPEVDQLHLMSV